MSGLLESVVEDATLEWLKMLGRNVTHVPEITPYASCT